MAGARIPLIDDSGGCTKDDAAELVSEIPQVTDTTRTNILVLNVTMRCPLRCDFCCYACHPKREEEMPLSLALDVVEQAAALGEFSVAAFTGGEPFLWYENLLATGKAMHRAGLGFRVVSAGHWAEDPGEARHKVRELVDRGMYMLCLSTDPSHARFVAPQSVVNAALAASDLGIQVEVVGAFADPDQRLEEFVPALVDAPNVRLASRAIVPAGRGRKQKAARERDLGFSLANMSCYRPIYHDLVIFSDGDAYPCCSVFNREADGIKLGNANTDSIRTLWERAEGSMLLRTMKRAGFAHLYKVIEEFDPDLHRRLPPIRPETGPCHLCSEIFGDVELAREIRAVFVSYERRIVAALLDSLQAEFGAEETASIVRAATSSPTNEGNHP